MRYFLVNEVLAYPSVNFYLLKILSWEMLVSFVCTIIMWILFCYIGSSYGVTESEQRPLVAGNSMKIINSQKEDVLVVLNQNGLHIWFKLSNSMGIWPNNGLAFLSMPRAFKDATACTYMCHLQLSGSILPRAALMPPCKENRNSIHIHKLRLSPVCTALWVSSPLSESS